MSYTHYTGFTLKFGNKTVTEILQSGKIEQIINNFVIVLKKHICTLCIIAMDFTQKRCKKQARTERKFCTSPGKVFIRPRQVRV